MIQIAQEMVGGWSVSSVVFKHETRRILLPVNAIIGNSVATSPKGKEVLLNWKRTVAAAAKRVRGVVPLDSNSVYSISAGFSFHIPSHGNQELDVENFLKPSFDALAAGLFCEPELDCMQLDRFAYDDTGFKYLFVYRLPDAPSAEHEGVGFVVSVQAALP